MATLIAVKSARDKAQKDARKAGISTQFTAYVAQGGHSCIAQAFDILGIGTDALRKVPLDQNQQMDMGILEDLVNQDRAAGLTPLMVVGTAGSVNLGAIDNLDAIADFTAKSNIWFHIDGAFGATAILVDEVKPRLKGLERADSLAFDFHKWMHVNYDAGCVLIKDAHAHKSAFSDRPEYLRSAERGLAAGDFWAVDYGLELSRGFRALKVWAHLAEFGTDRIGQSMGENIKQAQYLGQLVDAHPDLTMMCPVMLNIAVFQYGNDDEVNGEIVARLQESGIAVPSTTLVDGRNCIRINITNHRTQMADMDVLVQAVVEAGNAISQR